MKVSIVKQPLLDEPTRRAMFDLHELYFENNTYDRFLNDLAEKQWVILLKRDGEIVGFSTIAIIRRNANERRVGVLYSGDTIVDDRHRRTSCALAGAFGSVIERFRPEFDDWYWFLISKGHRTYRMLPTFFHRFYPGLNASEESGLKPILDAVATEKFGDDYQPDTGLIVYADPRDKLKTEAAEIPQAHATCPYVELFLARNPAYRDGVELACITSLESDNLNDAARYVYENTAVEWVE